MQFNFFRKRRKIPYNFDPDQVFLDSRNLPSFNNQQFEGRIERPIDRRVFVVTGVIFALITLVFIIRLTELQVVRGQELFNESNSNKLSHKIIFPDRGIIYDRNRVELAWNNPDREYIAKKGFAHILGYIGFPDDEDLKAGAYHEEMLGKSGVEKVYNDDLSGTEGIKIEELTALGEVNSDHVLEEPKNGDSLELAIDARLQEALYEKIEAVAVGNDYEGGSGVIMDVSTGEIIALVSYPEYDPNILVDRVDSDAISQFFNDSAKPFLNRAVSGLYTPGSIIKPFIATGALKEEIINPSKQILSTGELVVPNPYNKDAPSIFKDWKAHGLVDMRRALAVSSNVYFYQIGGGFGNQLGLGISGIEEIVRLFGFGAPTGIDLLSEEVGVIPNPKWKAELFDDEPWRLGDTYHTAIGQYGFLVTPIQVATGMSAIANGGKLVQPKLLISKENKITDLGISEHLQVIRDGLRQAVTEGTAAALNVPYVKVGAKTGTAELGVHKENMNAWITGFFPYDQPRYAFAVVMERGPKGTLIGGGMVMRGMLDWMNQNTPEYFD